MDSILVPARVTEVTASYEPIPLVEKFKLMTSDRGVDLLTYTSDEIKVIEKLTINNQVHFCGLSIDRV